MLWNENKFLQALKVNVPILDNFLLFKKTDEKQQNASSTESIMLAI